MADDDLLQHSTRAKTDNNKKTPVGDKQSGCLSPSPLPAQSPHVEKNPPPCQLMIPVERVSRTKKNQVEDKTSKTPERRSATIRVQGSVVFFFVYSSFF